MRGTGTQPSRQAGSITVAPSGVRFRINSDTRASSSSGLTKMHMPPGRSPIENAHPEFPNAPRHAWRYLEERIRNYEREKQVRHTHNFYYTDAEGRLVYVKVRFETADHDVSEMRTYGARRLDDAEEAGQFRPPRLSARFRLIWQTLGPPSRSAATTTTA